MYAADYRMHSAAASTLQNNARLPAVECLTAADAGPAVCEAAEPETLDVGLLLCPPLALDVVFELVEPALAGPVLFTARLASTTFMALNSWPTPVSPSNDLVHLDPHSVPLSPPVHC